MPLLESLDFLVEKPSKSCPTMDFTTDIDESSCLVNNYVGYIWFSRNNGATKELHLERIL
jgi:hypothetical protein